ncbi:MAG: hypothetical protein NDJ89_04605 [Oligoflexia bacterium]|nr:hypothetical protein [Oligoflexia bacterium]
MRPGLIAFLLAGWLGASSAQADYVEELNLCDLGIRNPDISNQLGVDRISFTRARRREVLVATPVLRSASETATEPYDRWAAPNALSEVELELGSEVLASEYFLELCYTWRRDPGDTAAYEARLLVPPQTPPELTRVSWSIRCVSEVLGVPEPAMHAKNAPSLLVPLEGKSALRCAIRFSFQETGTTVRRPHDHVVELEPRLSVEVGS